MKKITKPGLFLFAMAVLLSGCYSGNMATQTQVSGSITYQSFYDNLSPYGTWIDYPEYGDVWNPRVEGEFRPYATNGNWAYSTEGWAWESNYSWGWAPFHYGSWLYDDIYGWLWVPGYDWSPAWVTWGSADNYYCWAPIMPGVNVNMQFQSWRPHSFYWNVCSRDRIYERNLSEMMEPEERRVNIVNHITIINNFNTTRTHNYYAKGPEVHEVERYTNRKIEPASFKDARKINEVQLQGNKMKVYRPAIQNPQTNPNMKPREFRRPEVDKVKPIRTEEQRPRFQRNDQKKNIDQLPVHREKVPQGGNKQNGKRGRVKN